LIQIKADTADARQITLDSSVGTIMIICSCHTVSDHEVRDAIETPVPLTVSQVYRELNCKPHCGRCAHTIRRIMKETKSAIA
jgi:bacterioferritin-associated ferredoxin